MTIYILGTPEETAQALDDKSLDKMVKDIAQVLCNVCYWKSTYENYEKEHYKYLKNDVPLKPKIKPKYLWEFSQWAILCKANYLYLVDFGFALYAESVFRFGINKYNAKYRDVIRWCYDNVPDLPECLKSNLCKKQTYTSNYGVIDYEKNKFIECQESHDKTPFPLVMHKKHSEHTPTNRRLNKLKFDEKFEFYHAYRSYYQEKIKNKLSRCFSIFESSNEICGGSHEDGTYAEMKWTRREKPEWINLEN